MRSLTLIIGLLLVGTANAQSSANIVSSARSVDWSIVGIPGGLPDGAWTQCGSTIAAYNGTAGAITTALSGCSANQYVLLGAGTFNLTTAIQFPQNTTGHLVLRGAGANSTFLVFSAGSVNCGGFTSVYICIDSTDGTYPGNTPNTTTWTAGYTQGATQITLGSVSGITINKTMLILNQCDTGFSGSACTTGSATDNSQAFECSQVYQTGPITGCAVNGADGSSWRMNAWQTEIVTVTAINPGGCGATCVTISQPLKHPNWSSGSNPQAVLISPIPQDGVENLSIDGASGSAVTGIMFYNAYEGWVSGVKIKNVTTWFVNNIDVSHMLFQNNYLFNANCTIGCDPYGIRIQQGGDDLIQNNIIQTIRLAEAYDGPESGGVVAYNLSINQLYQSDFMFGAYWTHSAGDDFDLWEGNIGNQMQNDNLHGTHIWTTKFRNFFEGWESCANLQCAPPWSSSHTYAILETTVSGGVYYQSTQNGNTNNMPPNATWWQLGFFPKDTGTNAIVDDGYNRYTNNVGNVLGTFGFSNAYSNTGTNGAVYAIGAGNAGSTPPVPTDSLVLSTSMYWASYDTYTGAVRFCGNSGDTGWSSTCTMTSEIPTGASTYPNSVPTLGDTVAGQQPMPASFYLASKPSWFGSVPWPAIGPDVTSGNIGQCSGSLNVLGQFNGLPATSSGQCTGSSLTAGWGGHVNANPAMACYFSLGGNPDGTSGELSFDATTCYGNGLTPIRTISGGMKWSGGLSRE